jgi:hypothetical protein
MSLFKILITKGKFTYSCYIQARSTAEAMKFAKHLFSNCDERLIIQI